MNIQMFLLYICILQFVSCDDSSFKYPPINVSATVGTTALLRCNCTTEPGKTRHVWWKNDNEKVFEREGGDSYHGKGYEGRVDVPEDELNKGNCSLVLKNVRVTDDDVYKCSLVVNSEERPIQKVHLTVDAKETTTQSSDLDSFRDNSDHSSEHKTEPPAGLALPWIIIITVLCVGLVAVAVMMIIYRKKRVSERNNIHDEPDAEAPELEHFPVNRIADSTEAQDEAQNDVNSGTDQSQV